MGDPESDLLGRLQAWYVSNVDGGWEHKYGIELETLDNPGWHLEIDLADTSLSSAAFEEVKLDRTEHDWTRCSVSDAKFHAHCGPQNLTEVLGTFLDWASTHPPDQNEQAFSPGDAVRLSNTLPSWKHAGESASVSGVRRVETVDDAVRFQCRQGTVVYEVALADGSATEVFPDGLEASPTQ